MRSGKELIQDFEEIKDLKNVVEDQIQFLEEKRTLLKKDMFGKLILRRNWLNEFNQVMTQVESNAICREDFNKKMSK